MSLGKDLARIRGELGLSLEEIQSSIKIPLHILKSIENDSIFQSTEHNQTYIRSFIRSYARGLHLSDEDVVNALDAVEAGNYEHDLLSSKAEDLSEKSDLPKKEEPFDLKNVSPPEIEKAPSKPKPTVENVNWADLGKKFSLQESASTKWVLIVIIAFIFALLATGFFFREEIIGFFDTSSTEVSEPMENDFPVIPEVSEEADSLTNSLPLPPSNSNDTIEQDTEANNISVQSGNTDTLTIAVYAAFDKLEPVRVTSDLNWRTNPFWMEQGEAFNFNFRDSIVVRGQYSRMLLLFNGNVIRDHTQYYDSEFESLLITRSILDSTGSSSENYPEGINPPDSLVYRINY